MDFSTSQTPNDQIRKVAILLASLDHDLAEDLLAQMPTGEAHLARQALEDLGDVDSAEHAQVLSEFNRQRQQPAPPRVSHTDGVELDPSLLARIEQSESEVYGPQRHVVPRKVEEDVAEGLNNLSDDEVETIVETLLQEHPQTIALTLSRLAHRTAGKIVAALPTQLQEEVLNRVGQLDPADESSTEIVEAHLSHWLKEHRQRQHRMAAGKELVEKIREHTPSQERTVVVGKIRRDQPELTQAFGAQTSRRVTQRPAAPRTYKRQPYQLAPSAKNSGPVPSEKYSNIDPHNPLQVLEESDDATLIAVLSHVEAQIVTLALAGASEKLLSRMLGRLPRREAKALRQQLRNIEPTRLSDMLEAQNQLARYAIDLQK